MPTTWNTLAVGGVGTLLAGIALTLSACGGETETSAPAPAPEPEAPSRPEGPLPSLLAVFSAFDMSSGKPVPQPAKMVLLSTDGKEWFEETIVDEDSNVFHKAMPWRGGFLTIGAMKANLKHWTRGEDGTWTADTLWTKSWGGKFDRLRDIEIGDVDGDGQDEIVIATHDQGVVAVGDEKRNAWTFTELDQQPDTFVHEIEIGDLEGDGKLEFYCTPSERNRASGVSQSGEVVRYDFDGESYKRSQVVSWEESHAKEVLIANLDGDDKDELYVVREAHTEKKGGKTTIVEPVKISRVTPTATSFEEEVIAELEGDKQSRFLVAGDLTGDGKPDLVAAGMDTGLWMLQQKDDGTFEKVLIDANSGGFEHATHLADLDGDGVLEVYVAADKQQQIRRYDWTGSSFGRKKIWEIPDHHITWNLQDGTL